MFTARIVRPGDTPLELTPIAETVRFAAASVGGFGACSFDVPIDVSRVNRTLPWLAKVQLFHGSDQLWEGRIEDRTLSYSEAGWRVSVQCFGYRRLLEDTSLQRVWSLRSIPWQPSLPISGLAAVGGVTPSLNLTYMFVTTGMYDPEEPSRIGVLVDNYVGGTPPSGASNWAVYRAPPGVELVKLLGWAQTLAGGYAFVQTSDDASSWTADYQANAASGGEPIVVPLTDGARWIALGSRADGAGGNNGAFWDIRLLGTSVDEDQDGGFYGGTLMRDVVSLVTGLHPGVIAPGNEYAIAAIARAMRDSALSVVEEIGAYYQNEWGVWEDGRFDWLTPNLEHPHWVVDLASITALDLTASAADVARRIFVLYEDAATGEPREQSTESEDGRNPWVKTGQTRDELLQAPVVMTDNTALGLSTRIAADRGLYPIARGSLELPADALVKAMDGRGARPAFTIRAGENIVIPSLPKSEVLQAGRDGQTLFHVVSAETDMRQNATMIALESYSRSGEVLLARLSAATRILQG